MAQRAVCTHEAHNQELAHHVLEGNASLVSQKNQAVLEVAAQPLFCIELVYNHPDLRDAAK
ncbi:hypothetical protein D9M72_648410 [compost metagenome]